MKKLSVLLLLFFISCNAQQKITYKKYINMETLIEKYRDIKLKYYALVENNRKSLIYEDGIYLKKTAANEKKQKTNVKHLQLQSQLILEDNNKAYLVKDEGKSEIIYTYYNDQLVEKATIDKENNAVFLIDNIADGTAVRYDADKHKMYLSKYVQDKNDPNKRDIMLDQEFENDKLISEKDYEKDFKISKESLLENLPENFHKHALEYFQKKQHNISSEKSRLIIEKVNNLKERLELAIQNHDDFYRQIQLDKTYDQENQPMYIIRIPAENIGTGVTWNLNINGKTNDITRIELEVPDA